VRVVFSDEPLRGFWPSVGPYTMEGDIAPGRDYAWTWMRTESTAPARSSTPMGWNPHKS
jgi:hypothetical protein